MICNKFFKRDRTIWKLVEHFEMRSYRLFQCCTLYQCPRNCWQRIDRFDLCHRLSSKSSLYPCQVYLALAIFQFRSPFLLTTRNPSNTNSTIFVHHSKYSIEIYKLNEKKIKKCNLRSLDFHMLCIPMCLRHLFPVWLLYNLV